jgi:hypothetical protein
LERSVGVSRKNMGSRIAGQQKKEREREKTKVKEKKKHEKKKLLTN